MFFFSVLFHLYKYFRSFIAYMNDSLSGHLLCMFLYCIALFCCYMCNVYISFSLWVIRIQCTNIKTIMDSLNSIDCCICLYTYRYRLIKSMQYLVKYRNIIVHKLIQRNCINSSNFSFIAAHSYYTIAYHTHTYTHTLYNLSDAVSVCVCSVYV